MLIRAIAYVFELTDYDSDVVEIPLTDSDDCSVKEHIEFCREHMFSDESLVVVVLIPDSE